MGSEQLRLSFEATLRRVNVTRQNAALKGGPGNSRTRGRVMPSMSA